MIDDTHSTGSASDLAGPHVVSPSASVLLQLASKKAMTLSADAKRLSSRMSEATLSISDDSPAQNCQFDQRHSHERGQMLTHMTWNHRRSIAHLGTDEHHRHHHSQDRNALPKIGRRNRHRFSGARTICIHLIRSLRQDWVGCANVSFGRACGRQAHC